MHRAEQLNPHSSRARGRELRGFGTPQKVHVKQISLNSDSAIIAADRDFCQRQTTG
jgi:hypothetical protein